MDVSLLVGTGNVISYYYFGNVGRGHQEDTTAIWLMSWPWTVRGPSPPPLPFEWEVWSSSHSWSHFQGHSLERAMCCWDRLVNTSDWILLRPKYKLSRFWWAGVKICSSCNHPKHASDVSYLHVWWPVCEPMNKFISLMCLINRTHRLLLPRTLEDEERK